jgi:diguanylate cyclase
MECAERNSAPVTGRSAMLMTKTKRVLQLVTPPFAPLFSGAPERSMPGSPATREYYRRIEDYAHRIRRAGNVDTIIHILDEALGETRALNDAAITRFAPAKLADAEREIEVLKQELEEVRALIHVDHLTGALNRSGLDAAYEREAARADRLEAPLGAALLDIDDFKLINDRHGHQAGDAALVHFARAIRRTLRPSDVVVRFGGEEFLCLLPGSGSAQTAGALRRLQQDLDRSPLVYMGVELQISFSAGIAARTTGETRDSVIARADRALYQAKDAGKKRAVTAD